MYARQQDMNARVVLTSTCVKVVTPASTYRKFFICMFSGVLVDFLYSIPSKILSSGIISWNFIYNANRIFNCGSFIIHALLPGTSKAFTQVIFFARSHPSAGHTIYIYCFVIHVLFLLSAEHSLLFFYIFFTCTHFHVNYTKLNHIHNKYFHTQIPTNIYI